MEKIPVLPFHRPTTKTNDRTQTTSMVAAGDGSLSSHCPSELGWADLSQVFMEEINLRV